MVDSLFSESWYRVSELRPRLRIHAQIHRHTYRGRSWYLIQDHSTGHVHRFSAEAYHIIGLMDGRRTLREIWEAACASLGDDMPTQEEVIQLLFQLHQADVLQTDITPDIADLHQRHERGRRNRILGQLTSPFAIRFPVFDPEKFLSATQAVTRPIYGWIGLLVWSLAVISALFLIGIHWEELTSNMTDRVLAAENLLLLWLVYPFVKILHEFSHAYAVKRWGGEVHEMGIMLLVFVPIPYMEASSASAFREKYQRIMVGAAGIMTELFLAAVAMWIWVSVEPGAVRSLAFNVVLIAGVSTLIFNGNPLLRYDSYYMLSDFLEIPNLGLRANRYIGYLCQRYLFNMKDVQSPVSAPGESAWMGFYGIASFAYRIFIMIRIAMFVAGKFFVVGVVLAIWGIFSMLILPFYKVIKYIFTDSGMQNRRKRVLSVAGISAGLLLLMVLLVPVPSFTVVEGVISAPENSQIYAGTDGFVKKVIVSPGQMVHAGESLISCENSDLEAEVKMLEAQLAEFESRHRLSMTKSPVAAEIIMDEINSINAELETKRVEKEDLLIRSPGDGVFLLPDAEDLPGAFIKRGMPLGYVVDFSRVTARAVVSQADVDRVRTKTLSVSARLAEEINHEFKAVVKRELPAATSDLPSLALSLEGGGSLALDPREANDPRTLEKLFHFEIIISGSTLKTIGERVFVRFEHSPEPLMFRWYRALRMTFLGKFSV
jgi:putative peptide zinc metalloprotease protein